MTGSVDTFTSYKKRRSPGRPGPTVAIEYSGPSIEKAREALKEAVGGDIGSGQSNFTGLLQHWRDGQCVDEISVMRQHYYDEYRTMPKLAIEQSHKNIERFITEE